MIDAPSLWMDASLVIYAIDCCLSLAEAGGLLSLLILRSARSAGAEGYIFDLVKKIRQLTLGDT